MYFPTGSARQLSTTPALPHISSEPVIFLAPSARKALFCILTRTGLSLWRVRPSVVLAHLQRTEASLEEHGTNFSAHWAPDGKRIVIQTSKSYLVLVTPSYDPNETPYQSHATTANAVERHFLPGPGEAQPLQSASLRFEGVIKIEGNLLSVSPRKDYILFSTQDPPAIQRIPWPTVDDDEELAIMQRRRRRSWTGYDTWQLNEHEFPWLLDSDVTIESISHSRTTGLDVWITSDGRAYVSQLQETTTSSFSHTDPDDTDSVSHHGVQIQNSHTDEHPHHGPRWYGTCVHTFDPPRWAQKARARAPGEPLSYIEPRRATVLALNARFALYALGAASGSVSLCALPSTINTAGSNHSQDRRAMALALPAGTRTPGAVRALEWSADGYVLACGWENGWAVWSVGGRCLACGMGMDQVGARFADAFMFGVDQLFWAPGSLELFLLAKPSETQPDGQLFVLPLAKSASAGQLTPDNTRYAFLQLDDRVLVYRGADQPDMSVINPEADVWQHIKIPQDYLAAHWPIRHASLSADGRLVAVAGRRGLAHYSANSGRWKRFADEAQENAFSVRGGMLWFHHVLVAAVEVSKSYQIRLYSRDAELSARNVLYREVLPAPVVLLSLVDNSLLAYTADNTLAHFLVVPTRDGVRLHHCGSISFDGVVANPTAVRALSWMIPSAQKQLGDPAEDLSVATVLMMVGGNLILLRPTRTAEAEVRYDMQVIADQIEFCWIHLRGIGALENSLWAYDGRGLRVWLDALTIENSTSTAQPDLGRVRESVNIPLDFYPLSVLMDKGIIIGAEYEALARATLPFVLFRHSTSSHLFLPHILRAQLTASDVPSAVSFASHYRTLVFFAHALEILLHTVVEDDDAEASARLLPEVVGFLDHFDEGLDVVVRCARKTEMTHWGALFDVAGSPEELFESCLAMGRLATAAQYLLILHTLQRLDGNSADAVRLLRAALDARDNQLCREVLRFLRSVDDSGAALKEALAQTGLDVE